MRSSPVLTDTVQLVHAGAGHQPPLILQLFPFLEGPQVIGANVEDSAATPAEQPPQVDAGIMLGCGVGDEVTQLPDVV